MTKTKNASEEGNAKLFFAVSKAMHGYSVDDVIPVLITASARALVDDAGANLERLAIQFARFSMLLKDQIHEMVEEDEKLARESTRQ
jgi:hypothetical protein